VIHTVSTTRYWLKFKIDGVMDERRGCEVQNRPFLRRRFSIYMFRRSSYSWQAFQQIEAQLSPNYPQSEAERARYAWLQGTVRPPSGDHTAKPADSAQAQATVHGVLVLRILARARMAVPR